MARFCLCYGIQPSEYLRLTVLERAAFNTEATRIAEERKR
jgi:hypothetical protein